jgi:signal transduction histidine kinase
LRHYPDTVVRAPGDLVVRADSERVIDIVLRLVDNAFQHARPPVTLTAAPKGTAVVIGVEDHGDGVPVEFVPRLFESFTQADTGLRRRTSGAGLGLALVAELVSAMAGDVWYETADNGGARVCIRLQMGRA